MADLIPFSEYLDSNKHWNELTDQRDNLRKKAKDKGKAENKLMMAQAYTFAASLLEQKIIFEWECDCSDEEVKAVSKWTGVNLEAHIEYIAEVIDHLRFVAAEYGADARKILARCRECDHRTNRFALLTGTNEERAPIFNETHSWSVCMGYP